MHRAAFFFSHFFCGCVCVGLVLGATKGLTVDLAFLIESQHEAELPETILGTVRFRHVDLSVCRRIPAQPV